MKTPDDKQSAPLTAHRAGDLCNDGITVEALDTPGNGGAHHLYGISWADAAASVRSPRRHQVVLPFQDGPVSEVGVNGVSNEALLAVVIDRLKAFQAGPYDCRENLIALTKLQEGMRWLHQRTRARMERGVEGKQEK